MTPQYQFNLGQTDPLLSGRVNPNEDYFTAVNQEIERLNKIRTQLIPPTVAQVKKYPEVLGGVEIGNGTIRVKIPLIDKVIELDTNDLTAFRETLTSK